jgi:hypothetical protein
MVLRVLSGFVAVVLLFLSASVTLGMSLAAPFGVYVGRRLAIRGGRPFTGFGSWLSAAAASAIGILIALLIAFSLIPEKDWQEIQHAVAQAQAQDTAGMPKWVRPDPLTAKVVTSRAFTITFGVLGGVIACAMLGAVAGTPGWLATLFLSYAIRGRRAPNHPSEGDRHGAADAMRRMP